MYLVNGAVAVIRHKQPFIDWVHSAPDKPTFITLESCNEDCNCFLLPEHETEEAFEDIIYGLYDDIFTIELHGYYTDESMWPEDRSYKTFLEWFDIEVHSMLLDPYKGKIKKEKFGG